MKRFFVGIVLSACALVEPIVAQPSSSPALEDARNPDWAKGIRPTGPVVNIKELGAKGDGVTNDSAAFREAARIIEKAGGGTLSIPLGTYIVGEQTQGEQTTARDPYYKPLAVFHIKEVAGLIIEGNGATLKLAPGLHYGSFDNKDGKRIDPELRFIDRSKRADIGSMIDIYRSKDIIIRNLELDGNNGSIVQGGKWGDKGRQCDAYGLRLYNNSNVLIENVYSHHHGLDGIIIGYRQLKEEDPPTPHFLVNVRCEYNGRQGLSWVGGRGLTVLRSKFNYTGMAAIDSSPRSGVDIEAENSICRDGYFEECEMIGNHGPGMLADSGDGGYTKDTLINAPDVHEGDKKSPER